MVHQSSIERFSKPRGVGHPHQNRGGRPQAVSVLAIRDLAGAKKAASDLAEKATPAKCVMTAKHADLPPAAYTAIVSGVNGTGVALVEVYALP